MLTTDQKKIRDKIVTDSLEKLREEIEAPSDIGYASKLSELVELVDKLSRIG